MLSGGYPFRYINSIVGTLNQIVGVYGNSLSVPNPVNPQIPLGASIDITPLLSKGLATIQQELSYEKPNEPIDTDTQNGYNDSSYLTTIPGSLAAAPRYSPTSNAAGASSLSAAGFSPTNPEFTTYDWGAIGGASPVQPGQPSLNQLQPDFTIGLPLEGSIVNRTTGSVQQPNFQPPDARYQFTDPTAATIWGDSNAAIPPAAKHTCLLYTSPSPRDGLLSRMPSSA